MSPWNRRDLVAVLALNAVGLLAIVTGTAWAAGKTLLTDQFPATNLTVLGLIAAGLGNVAWLLAGRRSIGRTKRRLWTGERTA